MKNPSTLYQNTTPGTHGRKSVRWLNDECVRVAIERKYPHGAERREALTNYFNPRRRIATVTPKPVQPVTYTQPPMRVTGGFRASILATTMAAAIATLNPFARRGR